MAPRCGGNAMADQHSVQSDTRPLVTVVITCRERHGLTEGAIESIVDSIRMPARVVTNSAFFEVQRSVAMKNRPAVEMVG